MSKHTLLFDENAKPGIKGNMVFNCTRCPGAFEASNFQDAREFAEQFHCPEPLPVTKKADKPFDKEKFERMAAEVKKTFEKADWEERFDRDYVKVWKRSGTTGQSIGSNDFVVYRSPEDVKSFIQEERTQLLNAMEEIISGMYLKHDGSEDDLTQRVGFNTALDEIRSALERLRGKK